MTNTGFSDRSFDVTYCKDVLEHIPPNKMKEAVHEMWRVANKKMMIAFFLPPTDDPEEVRKQDQGFYYNRYNKQEFLGLLGELYRVGGVRVTENIGDSNCALYVVDKMPEVIRMLVAVDRPDWSGDITTSNMMKRIGSDFKCSRVYVKDLKDVDSRDHDMIYIHWVSSELMQDLEEWIGRARHLNPRIKILGGIRGEMGFRGAEDYLDMLDGVNTNNLGLLNRVKEIRNDVVLCHSAADTDMFVPMDVDRDPEFTVLWAGDMNKEVKNWETVPNLGYKYKDISDGAYNLNGLPKAGTLIICGNPASPIKL